jgi:hypothetical protein
MKIGQMSKDIWQIDFSRSIFSVVDAGFQRRQRRLEGERASTRPKLESVHFTADLQPVFSQLRQKRDRRNRSV